MKFIKMESCGNDYIIVNNLTKNIDELKENKKLIKKLCNRNFGIGANGIIFLEESKIADYKIDILNINGMKVETSGNGIIAISKYLYENNYVKDAFTIETNRINNINLELENNKIKNIMVNLGKPNLNPKNIPVLTDKNIFINQNMTILNKNYKVTCLSVGNPHVIFFDKHIDNVDLNYVGPYFGYHYKFPDKINVVLSEMINKEKIKIRIFESGIGEILSCGTASAAALVANYFNHNIEKEKNIEVIEPGGILNAIYKTNDEVIISGNSNFIYEGKVLIK